jgi:hypothetical protein
METAEVNAAAYRDAKGKEMKVGDLVLVPFRISKLQGSSSQLVHLETVEAYGHINPAVKDKLQGRTRTGIWVEPAQIELSQS